MEISQFQSNLNNYESDSELEELYNLPTEAIEIAINEQHNSENAKRKKGGERLPTRKPDPNVYNRNALLARENRKRKKAHVETLEKCLEDCKRVNLKLLEALKHQRKVTRRLEREKLYFKNIVANRTEIVSLVSALNGRLQETTPQRYLNLGQTSPTQDSLYSCSGSSSYEPDYPAFANFDFSDNGSVAVARNSTSSFDFNDSCFFNNFLTEMERPELEETWNNLLHDKSFGLTGDLWDKHLSASDVGDEASLKVQQEHSYVSSNNKNDSNLKDVTGVCLHIASGKVSLEFCPTCHWSSSQSPPKQLLQGDSIESL